MMFTPGSSPVAVTGASGFVGTHIVRELLSRGHTVRACVRDPSNAAKTAHLQKISEGLPGALSFAQGDLMKPGSYDEAFARVGAVVHTAAMVQLSAKDHQREIVDPSVVGTQNVLESIKKSGTVRRVVHTSSIAAIYDYPEQGKIYSEADWSDSATVKRNPYSVAKREAERVVAAFPETVGNEISVVHINPALIIGRVYTQAHMSGSASIVRDLVEGTFPANPQLHFQWVGARDVAIAHAEALEREETSGRYILANQGMWLQEGSKMLAECFPQYKFNTKRLPNLLLYLAAIFDSRIKLSLMRDLAGRALEMDNSRSRSELGIEYRPLRDSMMETVSSMVEGGWITPKPKR